MTDDKASKLNELLESLMTMLAEDKQDEEPKALDEDRAQELEAMETEAEAEDMAELDDIDFGYDDTQNNIIASLQDRWL